MRAPAANNDGMGSLLYSDGTCRFRVWAPYAQRVQLMGDFTSWNSAPLDLAPEGTSGNWSGDQIPVTVGQMYKYLITNRGGPNNDNSQIWQRTDARALQVQSSSSSSAGYVVAPFPSGRQPFQTPAFENFIIYQLHVGSFAGRNDGIPVNANTATFVDLIAKLDYIRGLGFNAITPLPITDAYCDVGGAGEGYGPSDMFASEDEYAVSTCGRYRGKKFFTSCCHIAKPVPNRVLWPLRDISTDIGIRMLTTVTIESIGYK